MAPLIKENSHDCSYSLLERLSGDKEWTYSNGLSYLFECRGSYTRTGVFYDVDGDDPIVIVDAPQFGYDFT